MVMTKEGEEGADNQEVEKKRDDRKMTTGKKMRKMRKRKKKMTKDEKDAKSEQTRGSRRQG